MKPFLLLLLIFAGTIYANPFEESEEDLMYLWLAMCIIEEAQYERMSETTPTFLSLSEIKFIEETDKGIIKSLMGADSTEGKVWHHKTEGPNFLFVAISDPDACAVTFVGEKPSQSFYSRLYSDYNLKLIESIDQGIQETKFYGVQGQFKKYGAVVNVASKGSAKQKIATFSYLPYSSMSLY
jgi:hypothetical protein